MLDPAKNRLRGYDDIGWTEVPGVAVKPGMFVARVTGTSMEPLIPDGSWCLFRLCPGGLARGPDRARAVRVGRRGRERRPVHRQEVPLQLSTDFGRHGRRHPSIQLLPLNPAFEPITLEPENAEALTFVGQSMIAISPSRYADASTKRA
jgi:hypothetical protein